MTARLHPGDVIHVWDHLVITLRDGDAETAFLSWYAIAYSASLGGGNVALVEAPGRGVAATLADTPGLGDRMQERLRGMGFDRAAIASPPLAARFERRAFDGQSLGVRIEAEGLTVEADWREAGAPAWVDGEGGGFHAAEDIWTAFVEAGSASMAIDGVALPGRPFADPVWERTLGRAMSSAHAALAEVRVTPDSSMRDRG